MWIYLKQNGFNLPWVDPANSYHERKRLAQAIVTVQSTTPAEPQASSEPHPDEAPAAPILGVHPAETPEDGTDWQQIESQVREARERRQRLQEELERLQSRSRQGNAAMGPESESTPTGSIPEAKVSRDASSPKSILETPPLNTNVPKAPGSSGVSSAEVAAMVKHGNDLLALGDIAAARSLFSRAARGGDPSALGALAQTYDPEVLGKMRVRGVKPDPAKAKAFYEQAEAARKSQ